MTTFQITLPDRLAQEAERAGLLGRKQGGTSILDHHRQVVGDRLSSDLPNCEKRLPHRV